jgi:regulator of protease activity HflC (stomatin/prohibitin superfamily)
MGVFALIPLVLLILIIFMSLVTVQQGTVAVVTVFGKFRRILRPGLNFKIPFIESIFRRISYQNRSMEL